MTSLAALRQPHWSSKPKIVYGKMYRGRSFAKSIGDLSFLLSRTRFTYKHSINNCDRHQLASR